MRQRPAGRAAVIMRAGRRKSGIRPGVIVRPEKFTPVLTYNPYFKQSMALLDKVMTAASGQGEFAIMDNK